MIGNLIIRGLLVSLAIWLGPYAYAVYDLIICRPMRHFGCAVTFVAERCKMAGSPRHRANQLSAAQLMVTIVFMAIRRYA